MIRVEDTGEPVHTCICTHTGLRYLFTIHNHRNGAQLYPVGSVCIHRFDVPAMRDQLRDLTNIVELEEEVRRSGGLTLTSKGVSRSALQSLHRYGAFRATQWNGGRPRRDYHFLLDMFNQRRPLSERQAGKVNAILSGVSAFLRETASGAQPRTAVNVPDGYWGFWP
ncbi:MULTISPECIES: hypothetical protein [Mycolicibacterium]|uniref:hypothetical protein n=1 Tax=Mycolicibacterium TaxID=1866885 RepID=UPI0010426341|nr:MULTISPECIES: hypothetical protein [Mycolicibacterium]MCC9179502.1 hypothetical protein [Mycolicibacterium mageritense]MCV7211493.1 hypothetical protein [Mycolicibacterium canariasense]